MLGVSVWEFMFVELWRYSADAPTPYQPIYRALNAAEALIWLVFAALVIVRNRQHRRSILELVYAALFFVFAMTDVREMYVVQPWLILFKGVILVGLLWARHVLCKKYYHESKW